MEALIWIVLLLGLGIGWELGRIRKSLNAIQHMMFTEWTERRRARPD